MNVIEALNHLYGAGGFIEQHEQFEQFCRQREERLLHIFDENRNVLTKPIFLFQPESLMLFQLLERDKFKLREEWVKHFPPRELEQMAVKWGTPYAL